MPLKYWGENCHENLVGLVGNPVKTDECTKKRSTIAYARYLVEVNVHDKFEEEIVFLNENGIEVT